MFAGVGVCCGGGGGGVWGMGLESIGNGDAAVGEGLVGNGVVPAGGRGSAWISLRPCRALALALALALASCALDGCCATRPDALIRFPVHRGRPALMCHALPSRAVHVWRSMQ